MNFTIILLTFLLPFFININNISTTKKINYRTKTNINLENKKMITVETVFQLNSILAKNDRNIKTVIVLGYHKRNDGGGGIFVYNPKKVNQNDGGIVFNGWQRLIKESAINIKWFGAISTKSQVTEYSNIQINKNFRDISYINTLNDIININTLAFQKALSTFLKKSRSNLLPGASNKLGVSGIFIPSGDYLVKENLMNIIYPENTSRTSGIKYFSDGQAILNFTHKGKDKYGFKNIDAGLNITFSDITFIGLNDECNLFYSKSKGGAQDYYFDRCNFFGNFDKVFNLEGSNNNSEYGFMKCNFSGKVNSIINISGDLNNISDQFLNYWFDQTKFWIKKGSIINANKGGHFKFVNCDWSGYEPNKESYYFKLKSFSSDRGVNDFRIINGRFEMKNKYSRVLKSNWHHGNIEINADFGSQTYKPFFRNNNFKIKHFEFNIIQGSGNSLNVNFKNSVMMGYHEINYKDGTWQGSGKFLYENCSFPYRNSLDNFIKINHKKNINKSGISRIEIKDAIFEKKKNTKFNYNLEIANVNFLPSYSNSGLKKKYFKISNPARGENPLNSQNIILNFPIEAESLITKVTWYLPKKELSSTRLVNFALTDIQGNVLKSIDNNYIQTGLVRLRDGFNIEQNLFINIKNLPEGKIVLKDTTGNSNQASSNFMCLIEYF